MVRPLTKRSAEGAPYTRLPEIEAAIAAALVLDHSEILRRARIHDAKARDFLPPECLVHLVREAHAAGHTASFNSLLLVLLERCAAMVASAIRGTTQRENDIRELILDRFADKFVAPNDDALDAFETRFSRAFRALRTDVLRGRKPAESVSLSAHDDGEKDAELEAPDAENPEVRLFLKQVSELVRQLPRDPRRAVAGRVRIVVA